MHHVCHAVDRMGDTRVRFKCAKAVRLCAARWLHVRFGTKSIPSQRARASSVGKTPSFSFCQVDMYASSMFSLEILLQSFSPYRPPICPNHLSLASRIFSLVFATPALALISSITIFSILFISIIHVNILS